MKNWFKKSSKVLRDVFINIKDIPKKVTVCTGDIKKCTYYDVKYHIWDYKSFIMNEKLIKLRNGNYIPLNMLKKSLDILILKMGGFDEKSINENPHEIGDKFVEKESIRDKQELSIKKLNKLVKTK